MNSKPQSAAKQPLIPKLGVITNVVFCLFWILKYFPPQVFLEERIKHQNRISLLSESERNKAIKKRVNITEAIILGYLLLYCLTTFFNDNIRSTGSLKIVIGVIMTLRLIDILQTNVNITLFDALRSTQQNIIDNNVYSLVRTIVLVCYNFIEVGVIFGLLYSLIPDSQFAEKTVSLSDKFYFSVITQLTIGYGDIIPIGWAKVLACFQGISGYFFSILIISRLLSSLPQMRALNK